MVSCFTINCTTEICRRRKCLLLLNLFRTSHKGLEYKKSLGSSNNNRDRCYLSRCDWKLWLDKVTNKVLRSVCSSHLCWPGLSQFPRENSLKVHWHEWEVRNRAEDNKKISINGWLFCLDWWVCESHIWPVSANQRPSSGSTACCDQSEAGKLSPLCSDNNRTLREKNGPNKMGTCQIKVICQSKTWRARRKKFIVFYNILFSPQHSSTGAILKSYGFEAFGSFCSV